MTAAVAKTDLLNCVIRNAENLLDLSGFAELMRLDKPAGA